MAFTTDAAGAAPPLCRLCGKPIARRCTSIFFGAHRPHRYDSWAEVVEMPATKEEAARFGNGRVVSVRWSERDGQRYVQRMGFWDGESYVSPYFCKDECARAFGYFAARNPEYQTSAYVHALSTQERRGQAPTA